MVFEHVMLHLRLAEIALDESVFAFGSLVLLQLMNRNHLATFQWTRDRFKLARLVLVLIKIV